MTVGSYVKQNADGGSDGTSIGQSATDKIGFYGVTPVVKGAAVTTVTFTNFTVAAGSDALNSIISRLQSIGIIA
jgi:hypothetical protein